MTDRPLPILDDRPYHDVLRAWMDDHGLSCGRAGLTLGVSKSTVHRHLDGLTPDHEAALRALMTLVDEGRWSPPPSRGN